MLDGQPLSGATVVLQSDQQGPAASAITDADGKFRLTTYDPLDGAPAGEYHAVVLQYEEIAPPPGYDPETSAPLKPPKLISPVQYSDFTQSGLKAHITEEGENFLEFNLTSTP